MNKIIEASTVSQKHYLFNKLIIYYLLIMI